MHGRRTGPCVSTGRCYHARPAATYFRSLQVKIYVYFQVLGLGAGRVLRRTWKAYVAASSACCVEAVRSTRATWCVASATSSGPSSSRGSSASASQTPTLAWCITWHAYYARRNADSADELCNCHIMLISSRRVDHP